MSKFNLLEYSDLKFRENDIGRNHECLMTAALP